MPRPKGLPKTGGRKKNVTVERVKAQIVAEVHAQAIANLEIVPQSVKIPAIDQVDIVKLAQAYAGSVIQALYRLVLTSPSHAARVAAAAIILDRGFGRPNQAVQFSGEVKLRAVSDSELAVMAGRMVEHFKTIEGRTDEIAGEFRAVAEGGEGEIRPDFIRDGTPGTDSHNLASLP